MLRDRLGGRLSAKDEFTLFLYFIGMLNYKLSWLSGAPKMT